MFTWICPQCGREVPPSYTNCPNCADREKSAATPLAATQQEPSATAAPASAAPANVVPPASATTREEPVRTAPPQYAPPAQSTPPPQYAVAPPRQRMPEWIVAVGVAAVMVALGAVAYFFLLPGSRKSAPVTAAQASTTQLERIDASTGKEHPYSKFLDVTGVRVVEDAKKKVSVKFLVVNHSSADLSGIGADVALRPVTAKPDQEPVTEFSFKLPNLGPYESREVSVPAKTKFRAYEIPDWQFLRADVEITSPK